MSEPYQATLLDMLDAPGTEAAALVLWFRRGKGERWRTIGTAATQRDVLEYVRGSGEFWILPRDRHP